MWFSSSMFKDAVILSKFSIEPVFYPVFITIQCQQDIFFCNNWPILGSKVTIQMSNSISRINFLIIGWFLKNRGMDSYLCYKYLGSTVPNHQNILSRTEKSPLLKFDPTYLLLTQSRKTFAKASRKIFDYSSIWSFWLLTAEYNRIVAEIIEIQRHILKNFDVPFRFMWLKTKIFEIRVLDLLRCAILTIKFWTRNLALITKMKSNIITHSLYGYLSQEKQKVFSCETWIFWFSKSFVR